MALSVRLGTLTLIAIILLVAGYMAAMIALLSSEKTTENMSYLSEIEELRIENNQLRGKLLKKDQILKETKSSKKDEKEDTASIVITKRPNKSSSVSESDATDLDVVPENTFRQGVIVLGMHRSGTSILGGLLTKMGLKTGGPLIGAAEDNAKGFFERIDVVLQNDELFNRQNMYYGGNTFRYDINKGLKDILDMMDQKFFSEGRRALEFLNSENSFPWMLKDPRLCITFRTWLPLLTHIPAIIFTYRHPYDVALSLKTRFEKFPIEKSLRLWYVYTKSAIVHSHDLCRVTTSHRRLMSDPKPELKRIRAGLVACGIGVPNDVPSKDVDEFIDPKLQHGKTTLKNKDVCTEDSSGMMPPDSWKTDDESHLRLYREVMRVYCGLEDNTAYKRDFKWDETIKDKNS